MKPSLSILLPAALVAATPTKRQAKPPPPGQLNMNITETAGGSVPNVSTPLKLSQSAATGFQLLTFLEILEVNLYYNGLQNLTNGVFNMTGLPADTIEVITKTASQEDIHVATLLAVLEGNNITTIKPCNYTFPISTAQDFFAIANVITPANFGSIIGLQNQIAEADPDTIISSSSILATEVRHEVFLRQTAGEIPNPAPFDTALPPAWAYNIGLQYIVPGSCPVEPALPIYPPIFRKDMPIYQFASAQKPTSLDLTWDAQQAWATYTGEAPLFVAWLNQANQPIYTPLQRTGDGAGTTTVPEGLNDIAFIAITSQRPDNIIDLAGATLAGPLAIPIS